MRTASMLVALTIVAVPATAADAPRISWGKPGVTLEQYRADAITCGRLGVNTQVDGTEPVETLKRASRQIDTLLDNAPSTTTSSDPIDPVVMGRVQQVSRIVDATNPRARFGEVRAMLQGTLDQCLTDAGYNRFQLTDGQRRRLTKMKRGSDERHAYLHRLASDPEVLREQPVTQSPQ